MSNAKNYQTQGGDKWVVEGELEITPKGQFILQGQDSQHFSGQFAKRLLVTGPSAIVQGIVLG